MTVNNIKINEYFGYSYKTMFRPLTSSFITVTEVYDFRLQSSKFCRSKGELNMIDLKNEILKYLKDNSSVSFVEIEQIFDEFDYKYSGNIAYLSKENENIVFWAGWNEEAFNVINELRKDGLILMDTCELVNYLAFGKVMRFPVASKESDAKDKMCWLPVQFTLNTDYQKEGVVCI